MAYMSRYEIRKSQECFVDHFINKCGSCIHFNTRNVSKSYFSGNSYKCLQGYYVKWDEKTCRYYRQMPADELDYVERYREVTGRRYYYILTAICEVLGISFESDFYNEIKTLIQLVRNDDSVQKEAIGYDTFGEKIAEDLVKDGNSFELCKGLLTTYLTKVYLLIKQNNQEEAIEVYKQMVTFLYNRYKGIESQETLIDSYSLNESLNKRLVK